ncbi:hypothetical protein D9R08_11995 [Rhodophyticola porphyridii]|uniref:Uncharacterized protein n=2 Tax=Rhodophyticola porphyridii TaxID=1852017 RepID=A0A3L9YH56_9RHOB|nr:hypothetical protein D9R08_11995 [Rhodophyticola porphyridii]
MNGLLDHPIRVCAPMRPDQPYLAQIKGLGFSFYAPTAMAAKRKAEEWRQAEYLKITSKAQRVGREEAAE